MDMGDYQSAIEQITKALEVRSTHILRSTKPTNVSMQHSHL